MLTIIKDGSAPFVSKPRTPFPFLCSLLSTVMLVECNRFSRPTAWCCEGSTLHEKWRKRTWTLAKASASLPLRYLRPLSSLRWQRYATMRINEAWSQMPVCFKHSHVPILLSCSNMFWNVDNFIVIQQYILDVQVWAQV